MPVSTAIEQLLGLTRHSFSSMVHDQLLEFPASRESYIDLLQTSHSRTAIEASASTLAGHMFENQEFMQRLAERLPKTFAVLFWTRFADALVLDPSCDFPGFGRFHRTGSGDGLVIGFDPDIRELKYPVEPPSPLREYFSDAHTLEKEIETEGLAVLRVVLRAMPKWAPTGRSELYPSSLSQILNKGLLPFVAGLLKVHPVPENSAMGNDTISVVAFGASLLTYHAWGLAFLIELSSSSEVVVPGIGRFFKQERIVGIRKLAKTVDTIAFEADKQFYEIVKVNMPPAPAPALAA